MKAYFTKTFKKNYLKRIQPNNKLLKRFREKYSLFVKDPSDGILHDHTLIGKLDGFRAFSVTGEIRVVYHIHNNVAYFVDIGTHVQVYGK